jgi:DNA-binding transcriptional LysR family regulator
VAAIGQVAPRIRLVASLLDAQAYGGQLDRGELDLAAAALPPAPGVSREVLGRDSYTVVARRGHPAEAEGLDLDAWCRWGHVVLSVARTEVPGLVDDLLAKLGLTRRIAVRVPSFAIGASVVAATDLLLTLPSRLAEREARSNDLVRFDPPMAIPPVPIFVAWATRRQHDPAIRWLRETLQQVAAAPMPGDRRVTPRG